ncbi:ATP-binding protein [Streptomyces bicolor]|uniref:ATP-binding protein n=1 Tax=Streptomyces bicolor TaxID=66874 RepID=UPI0004E25997|nr:ATP-binding protein [Streptomyces bicolor]
MTTMTTPRPRMKGHPGYRLTADRAPETAKEARLLARVAMAAWGLEDDAETAALVMSEFVANAVRHAHGPRIILAVSLPAFDRVYLAVTDRSPDRHPQLRTPDEDAGHGRGLLLVDDLANRWGFDLLRSRRSGELSAKRVWAELKLVRRSPL